MKTEFKRNAFGVTVNFKNMTQGQSLALCHALNKHSQVSAVCEDLVAFLGNTIQSQGQDDRDQELFTSLTSELK